MEQGATSHPGIMTRSRSGAVLPTPLGNLPQDLPKPKTKDPEKGKEIEVPSPWSTLQKHLKRNLMSQWARPRNPSPIVFGKKTLINWRRLREFRLIKINIMTTGLIHESHIVNGYVY
ncbi:hypothetical protein LIER_33283 [Lithospermum erythrorhizon]|uniref:Uncharacterized protein n=1 Tax=Lithospermum erythrorhizon TaxID=34254 RepID=A0AAV3RYS2_LITER